MVTTEVTSRVEVLRAVQAAGTQTVVISTANLPLSQDTAQNFRFGEGIPDSLCKSKDEGQ